VSATITATPRSVRWDLGDGTTVECSGPGKPYDLSRPPEGQSTDCRHVYE
jgi:hypothetical protein